MKDEQTWIKLTKEIAELKEELNKIKCLEQKNDLIKKVIL